jgi:hypothetical protein
MTEPLTEQALEDAMLLMDRMGTLDYLIVNPAFIRYVVALRNGRWGRSAYLRRRRGWAPK